MLEESVLFVPQGFPGEKSGQSTFGRALSVHSSQDRGTFRGAECSRHGAALTGVGYGERLFVASASKPLINVYVWGKDAIDQRIPVPETLTCLTLCHHPKGDDTSGPTHGLPKFRVPWLLAGGTASGRVYIWELASGDLVCVKDAHYQGLSVIKFSGCGTYLVTAGRDSRCIIWRTVDLVSLYDEGANVKPYATFMDHTLPVTDLAISDDGCYNDAKIYTVSHDATLRVYDIRSKTLITTFVLPMGIESFARDPANRCCYVGLTDASVRAIPFYKFNKNTNVLEGLGGCGRIITIEHDPNLEDTFTHHRDDTGVTSKKIGSKPDTSTENKVVVTQIQISLDGTFIISGDSLGRVFATDTITKQVVKAFAPSESSIAFLSIQTYDTEVFSPESQQRNDKKHRLLPQFKRALATSEPLDHEILIEIPPQKKKDVSFESWLEQKANEELSYKNLTHIDSTVISTKQSSSNNETDQKSSGAEEKLSRVSGAYQDLRQTHEKLLEEHKKLLESLNK